MDEPKNGLTPGQVERLVMLAEEAGEIVQAVGKVLRHGYESSHPHDPDSVTNRESLMREIRDFTAVASRMGRTGDLPIKDEDGFHSFDAAKTWMRKLPYTHHQGYHRPLSGG